ncbi:folate/biopterin family MFS transporter [Candidatus Synechococcus calcipolaris G9]|uniref:Folate/biopterin family MFS transporter n=1 Tax=Candidatus Synechococcus calcipolaris G9 TaxID=1497997 RepID=A0ABT6F3F8_9SYNE|nr:folate/biopterin family MFS transporter [Candidatus Synechococcus calcipolaris]MDG2992374.1 folate/biopterin family MFS transporter [Candidatus Synechococcus calcipolaris G9]
MLVQPSQFQRWQSEAQRILLFGQQPSRELFAILLVYFVQGILGLARLAISFFFKDELGLSPAQVAALMGVAAIPWVIKPLFGLISDSLPLLGYRRRSYLVLSGFLGCGAWLSLSLWVEKPWQATLAIALASLSIAISDVIVDSLVVERARHESATEAGTLQSLSWAATALGGILTAYFSGQLLEHFTTRTVFAITATFPLVVSGVAIAIAEEPIHERPALKKTLDHIALVRQALMQKTIWLPVAFLFLWQATPGSESAFFFFTTNELGFQPEFLGRVRLVTSVASLLGVWFFQRFLKAIPVRVIFFWSTIISASLGMTTLILVTHANRSLGIDDRWFSLGDSLILAVMGQIAFMPVLILAARLCPPGIEATLFALLMAISNLAGLVSHELGALLTHWLGITDHNFDALWLLVIITNLSTLLPLPLLHWLPRQIPSPTGIHVLASETVPNLEPSTPLELEHRPQ